MATPAGATTPATTAHDHAHDDVDFYQAARGWRSWMFTLDHKRLGVMYLIAALIAFAAGGVFALLVRTELLFPGRTIMDPDTYNRVFTLHGAVMVALFIIPALPGGPGTFSLPTVLGPKAAASPPANRP